uniref:Transmembrane protein TMEM132 C-terminal domain-containing protein n=1 Tax=Anopheles atroparvus TaxID=41427 RepID=A0A182ITC8_ANOAO
LEKWRMLLYKARARQRTRVSLRDISVDDYFLLVESLDTEVVAFAPMLASHHPRVIAVGEGNGELLRVTLLLSEECRLRRNLPASKQGMKGSIGPLVSALASVQVDFSASDMSTRPDTVQNDGVAGRERNKPGRELSDLEDILIGVPLKDVKGHEVATAVQPSRQHYRGGGVIPGNNGGMVVGFTSNKSMVHADATTLEIGMYIVLTAFCLAIAVFVVSCIVYASRYRPITIDVNGDASVQDGMGNNSVFEVGKGNESCATNVHDWVWLGRATMDRSNTENASEAGVNHRDSRMHIISNPMSSKYGDADESVVRINSFDNPNHLQLPPGVCIPLRNSRVGDGATVNNDQVLLVNSYTYNKRDRHNRSIMEEAPPLPPQSVATTVVDRIEYRPPVPPHRHMGVTAHAPGRQLSIEAVVQVKTPKRNNQRHARYSGSSGMTSRSCSATNPGFDLQLQNVVSVQQSNLTRTQHQIDAALFSNGVQRQQFSAAMQPEALRAASRSPHSFENMGFSALPSTGGTCSAGKSQGEQPSPRDLHMAERLVEQKNAQQTAFKFDTINHHHHLHHLLQQHKQQDPQHVASKSCRQEFSVGKGDDGQESAGIVDAYEPVTRMNLQSQLTSDQALPQAREDTLFEPMSSSDDNGGFVTPADHQICRNIPTNRHAEATSPIGSQVMLSEKVNKKATVVGNPMFSSSPDSELGPGESLGLDDLDMDYEQIMQYFDNLKESNA